MSQSDSYKQAWLLAIKLLAQREHGSQELLGKIEKRIELSATDSTQLIHDLQSSGYLSDLRYVDAMIRSGINRGRGPMKIQYDLRQKGVDDTLISDAMSEAGVDWTMLAAEQRKKKFGEDIPKDFKERARQSRFLAGRGFYLDSINAVFHEKC